MRSILFALAVASGLWSGDLYLASRLSREEAQVVARNAAQKQGIDLTKYVARAYSRELSKDEKEWTFLYECKQSDRPPGCFFWVIVDRDSGVARIWPGE